MSEPAKNPATYQDLFTIPDHTTGEILAGELVVTPRPSRRHVFTSSVLGSEVLQRFHFGRGGPGGWIILLEPEIQLGQHTLVPDVAGWRKERFPTSEDDSWISVVPDWICEILSPNTIRMDRITKMSIYRDQAVPYVWLVDPLNKTLEVFGLQSSGAWLTLGLYAENQTVRAEPFQDVEITLGSFWMD
ncbi:MAG: Uma2 family endonuclease [Deltaproteobacteria bacterium]|nr:Uma2 family endonuclease [Deltaproteobacteria bacterium]